MNQRTAAGVPPALLRRPIRLLRPRDALDVYADPRHEFARLHRLGLLQRVATGYFVIVAPDRIGDPNWRPPLVATAWAVAAIDYGVDAVAVCGPSAARHHGLIPRELATAFVAVPKQRPRLKLAGGEACYVRRDVTRLDLERWAGDLGAGWVTTLEQTVLDLATRPNRWELPDSDLHDAVRAARPRLQDDLLEQLAHEQRKVSVLARIEQLAS
ncbi:MAG: type IV toxin-antitoxin system AbiEi family antitoxin [Actinomycetota bacterium]|nr:type IV toxin-antitoxin system AbiEi family antitoxin [Actinomycetota bacterium]